MRLSELRLRLAGRPRAHDGRRASHVAAGAAASRPQARGREAAVALVLVPAGADIEVLLIRRAEHPDDPWSGHMALPGGRRERRDRGLLETARRETLEETGVALRGADLLGELDALAPVGRGLPRLTVRPFVFGLPARPEVRPGPEVAFHLWAPLGALKAGPRLLPVRVRGRLRRERGFEVGGQAVWGLTERMLAQLLDLI